MDNWVEYGIESAGEKTVGAKVEIDDLKITFDPIGLEWRKIQVTNPNDPWFNLFETGHVKFEMDFDQLLRGKYIVDTVEIENFIIGTKRTSDGSLAKGEREEALLYGTENSFAKTADAILKETIAGNPMLDIDKLKANFNADSLIKILDIKTLAHIEAIKQQVTDASLQWENTTADFEASKQRLREIENNIKAINPKELNKAPNIIAAITTVDDAFKSVNELKKSFDNRYTSITSDITNMTNLVGSIDDVVKSDYDKLVGLAKLPTLNTSGIAQILAGNEMYKRVMGYLTYVDIAKASVKKYSPEPEYEKQPRFEGQDIPFPEERGYPKFWIKSVKLSGGSDKTESAQYFQGSGSAKNITDNQNLTGAPITFELKGTDSDKRFLELNGLMDRRADVSFDRYGAKLSGVALKAFELGSKDFIATKITDARMNTSVGISVRGNSIDAMFDLNFSNFKLLFEGQPRNTVERIAREVLRGITALNVGLRLWNTDGSMKVALTTDLDNILLQRLTSVLGEEVTRLKNQLRAKLDDAIAEKRIQFEKYYEEQKAKIENKLSDYQSLLTGNISVVDSKKKELQDRLQQVEKGLGDQILDIFKKGGG